MDSFATDYTSLILNGRAFKDFIAGDKIELNKLNPWSSRNYGENSVTINKRADRKVTALVLRLVKNSDDDIYLNTQMEQDSIVIFNGSLVENYIDENNVASVSSYNLQVGSFAAQPAVVISNTDGNNVMEYTIEFLSATRTV